MLLELELENFRCFKKYKVKFDKFNIVVGKNNTGKSTIIDALKLVSNVRRYAPYRDFTLEDRDIPFSLVNLRYNYDEKESIVHARFSEDMEIIITFPVKSRPYVEFLRNGKNIGDKKLLRRYFKHSLGIVPPVGTFEEYEEIRDRKYLQSIMVSHLTPRHFRNIWYYFNEGFDEFRE